MKAVLRLPAFAVVAAIDVAERLFASTGSLYKLLPWTPFAQDTCHKYANLDAFWQIPPQCN